MDSLSVSEKRLGGLAAVLRTPPSLLSAVASPSQINALLGSVPLYQYNLAVETGPASKRMTFFSTGGCFNPDPSAYSDHGAVSQVYLSGVQRVDLEHRLRPRHQARLLADDLPPVR
jgi:hypothetical protein